MYEMFITIPHDKEGKEEILNEAIKACPKLGQIIITNANGTTYGYQAETDEKVKLLNKFSADIKVNSIKREISKELI